MTRHGLWSMACALLLLPAAGCSGSSPGDHGNNNTNTNGNVDAGPPPPSYIGAPDVTITSIAIYQGPKCEIMRAGQATACGFPLVAGRDALFRVFYEAQAAQIGSQYTARLSVDASTTYEVTGTFVTQSFEQNLLTTVSFVIPGDKITPDFSYTVAILQEGDPADDNPEARFPQQGVHPVTVEAPVNTLRIIIAPFAYHADGSGRLPDLSPTRVEDYRQRFLQLYPVSNVEITVRQPYNWYQAIEPDGTGWQQVGFTLFGFRNQDGTSDDVYYYGTFKPTETLWQFCGSGCLLGVTLLNDNPPDTGSVDLRLALGVGFDEVALDTAAHELGHSHGLRHAPCGVGVEDIDPNYPYADGLIGVWSWDIVNEQLLAPEDYTDIMGYCEDQWISDYHYRRLANRCKNVNLPWFMDPGVPEVTYQLISMDGSGKAVIRPGVTQRSRPLAGGRPVDVTVYSRGGAQNTVEGHFYRFDHLPGGWLLAEEQTFEIDSAKFTLEGRPVVALRPLASD